MQAAYERYTTAWRDSVFQARENYLKALADYWQEAQAAAPHVNFPKFRWQEIEVSDVDIRKFCGPIRW
ncbi:MAG: hypothetical protein ABSF52_06615 [Syntrophobacteraceae bacterium]|jgi:hypothetical protein